MVVEDELLRVGQVVKDLWCDLVDDLQVWMVVFKSEALFMYFLYVSDCPIIIDFNVYLQ